LCWPDGWRTEPSHPSARRSSEILLKYLGAYINRAAISPRRITAHGPAANAGAGSVTWTYATNAEPDRTQIRVATGIDFLAAFAPHILQSRLVRSPHPLSRPLVHGSSADQA
jgi:hypothetical protein